MKKIKRYELLPRAKIDFEEVKLHYKLTGVKGLKKRFSKSVHVAIRKILNNAGAYAIRYDNVRIAYTERFPYAIHFIVENNIVYIIAIIYETRERN